MADVSYERASRVLWLLLGIAVAVSVVHYTDNYVNYDDYPAVPDNNPVPAPSKAVVGGAWFVFTALGALAVVLWQRRRIAAAAWALAGYSVSGLVGFGHYTAPGAFDMVWWRQAHVVVDILCGLAVIGFAVWAARNAPRLAAEDHPRQSAAAG